jgi:methyltransferase (TIGR00027 family)
MSSADTHITHVSDTALWVATYRAIESNRTDALFRDPLARKLAGDRGPAIARQMSREKYTAWTVVTRTCIIDRFIRQLIDEGIDAVINLGAGLDTRPYRLNLPSSLLWIEVDYPQMIDYKESVLKDERPHCRLERVRLDLADDQARRAFFAQTAARVNKALVLTEGLVPYLTEEQTAALAADLHQHPSLAFWLVEYLSPLVYRFLRDSKRQQQMKNSPVRFFPPDWFGFFAKNGWRERETVYSVEESLRRGRRPPGSLWGFIVYMFSSKETRERLRRMSGFTLLVPVERPGRLG